ncbi:MAG: thermonuclease family protein [Thermodesulfobacteriota bacterium]
MAPWLLWAALLLALTPAFPRPAGAEAAGESSCMVRFVPDGDTVLCADGNSVRYIGINAPELGKEGVPDEPFARESREANRALVAEGPLRLVFDAEKTDRYGRRLCYVYNSRGAFVNGAMLEKGMAYVMPVPPNLLRQQELLDLQRKAMQARLGLWGAYKEFPAGPFTANPTSFRFHRPAHYRATKESPVFSTLWEAFQAGYAPCRECCGEWVRSFAPPPAPR